MKSFSVTGHIQWWYGYLKNGVCLFLWHFCHQRTRWIIQMAEAATWMQESDLCMWIPEFAGPWLLGHETIKIFLTRKWEDRLIILKGLRSENNFKGLVIVIKRKHFDLVQNKPEVWIKSTVKNVIFPITFCQQTDHTTSWLSQITQMKRLLFFCVQQEPHRLHSIDFFFSWSSLIYRPLFPRVCVSLVLFHVFICVCLLFLTLHVAWRKHSRAHWPGGLVLLGQHCASCWISPSCIYRFQAGPCD